MCYENLIRFGYRVREDKENLISLSERRRYSQRGIAERILSPLPKILRLFCGGFLLGDET
jgi:hypothetical protein